MTLYILLICIAVSLDAFSVSITNGLVLNKLNILSISRISGLYALFQVLMPLIGYILGNGFYNIISRFDHIIIFVILTWIGISMIKDKDNDKLYDLKIKTLIISGIATSLDALAAGVTFSLLKVNMLLVELTIFVITFIFCSIGVIIGFKLSDKNSNLAKFIGGITLIVMGIRSLLENIN